MTRKEAIRHLEYFSICSENYVTMAINSRDRQAIDMAIDALEEQRWIPLNERLPEEETYVLISKKPSPLSGKKWCVTIAGRFVDGRSKKIEWRDIGFGRMHDNDILAWMPLPQPYGDE